MNSSFACSDTAKVVQQEPTILSEEEPIIITEEHPQESSTPDNSSSSAGTSRISGGPSKVPTTTHETSLNDLPVKGHSKKRKATIIPLKKKPTKKQKIQYISSDDSDSIDSCTFTFIDFFKLLMLTFATPCSCVDMLFTSFRKQSKEDLPLLTKLITKLGAITLDNLETISWKDFTKLLKKQKFFTTSLHKQAQTTLMKYANILHNTCLKETAESRSSTYITETDGTTSILSTTAHSSTASAAAPSSMVSPLDEDTITTSATPETFPSTIGEILCSISSRNRQGRYLCKWTPKSRKSYVMKTSLYHLNTIQKVARRDWWKYSAKETMCLVEMDPKSSNLSTLDIHAMNFLHALSKDKQVAQQEGRVIEEKEEPSLFHAPF